MANDAGGLPERPDLPSLFQRLADAMVRLLGERFDLARVELKEDAARILGLLGELLLGAIAAGVGLVMVALAATDLLAPLVGSRALRLAIVGGTLLGLGIARTRIIGQRLARERLGVGEAAAGLREDLSALVDVDERGPR